MSSPSDPPVAASGLLTNKVPKICDARVVLATVELMNLTLLVFNIVNVLAGAFAETPPPTK